VDEQQAEVLEIVRFGVNAGVGPERLREAGAALAPWLAHQPGFLGRTLSGPDAAGRYVDVVRWRSLTEARAAGARIMAEPCAAGFMALIDPSVLEMEHLEVAVDQRP
jgi:hypothetical protein